MREPLQVADEGEGLPLDARESDPYTQALLEVLVSGSGGAMKRWFSLSLLPFLVFCGVIAVSCGDDETVQDGSDQGPTDQDASDTSVPDTDLESDVLPDSDWVTVTVPVGDVFAPGTRVRDGYTLQSALVAGDSTVTVPAHPNGVLLLERDAEPGREADFSWDNATVYFVIPDRFENGDTTNDDSYGRQRDGGDEVGTFHGGDLQGLTEKLDYIESLGVNAIWISPPYEQVHGWIGGGPDGTFQHFAYHGYWALDYTRLDANLGTEDDLRDFVTAAHQRGIRVIFDVVMNHPGYGTLTDLAVYLPEVLSGDYEDWSPDEGENWHSWNDLFVDYTGDGWLNWWGPDWIRATFPGHQTYGSDDLTRHLSYLPDFRTESTDLLDALPVLLQRKTDTHATFIAGLTVRDYLIFWLTDWVRQYGIDGFRCDTAKHVELEAWNELNEAAVQALQEWKADNPDEAIDDLDFWMTGEVFPHGVVKDAYFTEGGFDSLINFDFQTDVHSVLDDYDELDEIYASYAASINTDPEFNVLSYISSHDTHLYFDRQGEDLQEQFQVGAALLMLPGGVQIFYGDETARPAGPNGGEADQETRSDMNWDTYNPDLLDHWQRLGQFRNRHLAVGAGSHQRLPFDGGYAFAREISSEDVDDGVVVVFLNP